jgi:hypothetical protein
MKKKTSMKNTIELTRRNSKLEDLLLEEREQINPNQHQEDEGQGKDEAKGEEEDNRNAVVSKQETDSQGSEIRRSTREKRESTSVETQTKHEWQVVPTERQEDFKENRIRGRRIEAT